MELHEIVIRDGDVLVVMLEGYAEPLRLTEMQLKETWLHRQMEALMEMKQHEQAKKYAQTQAAQTNFNALGVNAARINRVFD